MGSSAARGVRKIATLPHSAGYTKAAQIQDRVRYRPEFLASPHYVERPGGNYDGIVCSCSPHRVRGALDTRERTLPCIFQAIQYIYRSETHCPHDSAGSCAPRDHHGSCV